MKTNKAIQPSVAITLDDVIFSNRNQAYGAYYLRKKYNKHLMYALLLIIFFFGTGVTLPLIWSYFFPNKPAPVTQIRPPVTVIFTKTPDVQLPPPPQTDPPREIVKNSHFGAYIPVDSTSNIDTTRHLAMPLENSNHSNHGDTLMVSIDTSNHIIPPDDTYFTGGIGEHATFMGEGPEKFHDWVMANINYPSEAIDGKIEGKVFFNFVINKKGEVSDISISRGVHSSINNETVRVLLSSPKWGPAKQNGHPVKERFYMQVNYHLQD
jgi:periplasmic protein TonB